MLADDYTPLIPDGEQVGWEREPHYPPKPLRVQTFIYACGVYAREEAAQLAGMQLQRQAVQTMG